MPDPAFVIDTTFVENVYSTLNMQGSGWSPLAASSLLIHLESRRMSLWTCDLQGAVEYELLVRFACEAMGQHYVDAEFCELYDMVQECNKIIEGAAYYAMISHYHREALHRIAKHTDEVIETFIRASIL